MHAAHRQWLDEHDALAAVLHSLAQLARRLEDGPEEVDFCASRAMLVYLGDFPERVHHQHEDKQLFMRLQGRDSALDVTLEQLRQHHGLGAEAVLRLAHQLNRAEIAGASACRRYAQEVDRFVNDYLAHMRTEEREVFPAAERLLTEAEWQALADVLERERDPLQGIARDAALEALLEPMARSQASSQGPAER